MANHRNQGVEQTQRPCPVFAILAPHDVLSDSLGEKLVQMARFRNYNVHLYGGFDSAMLHNTTEYILKDIDKYLSAVHKFIRSDSRTQ